jgi:20S proteasome subunit alpha 4
MEAVRKGSTAVAIRAKDVLVLGVERKSTAKLQESRTVRKMVKIDSHLSLAFAGLTADARVLINKARVESQSYRLTVEDACSVEYMAKYIAKVQQVRADKQQHPGWRDNCVLICSSSPAFPFLQRATQRGGRRPYGISTLLVGHDRDGSPHLYQTDPTGNYSEWTANAIGRSSKTVTEYLEKHHTDPDTCTEEAAIRLTVSALLEVVESGQKNIEIAVMRKDAGMELANQDLLDRLSKEITEEKEKAKEQAAARTENN